MNEALELVIKYIKCNGFDVDLSYGLHSTIKKNGMALGTIHIKEENHKTKVVLVLDSKKPVNRIAIDYDLYDPDFLNSIIEKLKASMILNGVLI